MGSEILCYICYIISWYALIPAIYRIIKRKSSIDYSIQSVLLEVTYNIIWLVYVIFNPTFELIVCAIIDVVLILIYMIVVFKYHKIKHD